MGVGTGSIKWFEYSTDSGVVRPIQRNEGNGEAEMNWADNVSCLDDYTTNSVNAGDPIVGNNVIQCRYIECYCQSDVQSIRRFTIGSLANYIAVFSASDPKITMKATSDSDSETVWIPYRYVAEKAKRVAFAVDSGKDDGDAT